MFSELQPIAVYQAAKRLRGVAKRTDLRRSAGLSEIAGADVFLKCEHEQHTGSFKLRGAFNAIASLAPEVRARGVLASSAGNHGLGVAFAARHFGIPATIYVPSTAPRVKKEGIAALGATVDDSEPDYDAAMSTAKRLAGERGLQYINPCLGNDVLAGQGTVALEIIEEMPELRSVIVNVGGAGLLGGMASLLRAVAPNVRILGAQSEKTAAMSRSLRAGRIVEIPSEPTLADGLAGQIDDDAFDIGKHGLDEIVEVSEAEIATAIAWLSKNEGAKVEGAGAAGTAALLARKFGPIEGPIAVVLSGGNIDADRLAAVLASARAGGETA